MEEKSTSISQAEGASICTPIINSTKGPNRSKNINTWTFQQVSLLKGLNSTKKKDFAKKWATLFYEANIYFNVVWHPTFIEAVKATPESQTYYKPPSYHGLHTNLLKQSKVDVSKQVTKRKWNLIHKYGATICFH